MPENQTDTVQTETAQLRAQLKELREQLSRLRKKGAETKMINVKLYSLSPKIQIAEATRSKTDIEKAKKALDEFQEELKAAEAEWQG